MNPLRTILIALAASLAAVGQASAGPSPEDMDYSVNRPLTVATTVKGQYRFDVIGPAKPELNVPNGENSSWYSDEILIVRKIATNEVMLSRGLKSVQVNFMSDGLSDEFMVMTEWSGGASCCLLVSAFRLTDEFEIVLDRHNNKQFDEVFIIAGKNKIKIYKETMEKIDNKPKSKQNYSPRIFNLNSGEWD
jgi:hypothetical protein